MRDRPAFSPATLLPNGKVLIVDGYYGPLWPTIAGAELYDPSTGTFASTGDMILQGYTGRTATLLTNGKVLFTGGSNDSDDYRLCQRGTVRSLDRHIHLHGEYDYGPPDHTATLLRDGTVLIAGSQRDGSPGASAIASAELYDPVTGTFSAIGDMTTPRFGQTATLLTDGTVLMSGGRLWFFKYPCQCRTLCSAITGLATGDHGDEDRGWNRQLNFWQWAWFWQNTPAFTGAPAGFGVAGFIMISRHDGTDRRGRWRRWVSDCFGGTVGAVLSPSGPAVTSGGKRFPFFDPTANSLGLARSASGSYGRSAWRPPRANALVDAPALKFDPDQKRPHRRLWRSASHCPSAFDSDKRTKPSSQLARDAVPGGKPPTARHRPCARPPGVFDRLCPSSEPRQAMNQVPGLQSVAPGYPPYIDPIGRER